MNIPVSGFNDVLHSLFLAQVLGLYLVLTAIIMVSRARYYQKILTHLKADSGTIILAGALGLIVSIPLVVVHNIWILESEVLITLVAWFLLIKSILWLSFPEAMVRYSKLIYSGAWYYVVATVIAIIGVVLMAHGFYLFL